jgi:hypothetical protein
MPKKQFVTFRTVILVFIGLTLFVCCAAANNPNIGTKKPTAPDYAPIKGNKNSMIYHRPGQSAYTRTKPEVCFARAEDAEASGFRAAKR